MMEWKEAQFKMPQTGSVYNPPLLKTSSFPQSVVDFIVTKYWSQFLHDGLNVTELIGLHKNITITAGRKQASAKVIQ